MGDSLGTAAIKASLERTQKLADEQRAALEERAKAQRDGAERYTPLLTETADEYNRTLERLAHRRAARATSTRCMRSAPRSPPKSSCARTWA